MIAWQTDVVDFVLDTLSFIEEQIRGAQSDPSDQIAAVDAARGVIPCFRERMLGLDHPITSTLMFVFGDWYEDVEWEKRWNKLSALPAPQFCDEAKKLLESIALVKKVLRGEPRG